MLLYLDLCCLQRPFDDPAQERIVAESEAVLRVLAWCETGGADLVSSAALEAETVRGVNPVRRAYTEQVLARASVVIRASEAAVRAAELEAAGVAPLDALHVASATAAGADYFCTCDDRLLRRARAVVVPPPKVVSPVELAEELGL